MKCLYHSADLDGHCSAAIVKHFNPETELIRINYGQSFPFDKIQVDEIVYMVDFSFQPFSDVLKLLNITKNFIWIDHHKSAIEEYEKYLAQGFDGIRGLRINGIGACQLTWEYFKNDLGHSHTPEFIKLLADYDVWGLSDRILDFQYGCRRYITDPKENYPFWKKLFDDVALADSSMTMKEHILKNGKIIREYVESENEKYSKYCSYSTIFEGYKAIIINKPMTSSLLFKEVENKDSYDLLIAWHYTGKHFKVSLYTEKDNIDVSEIAKKYGGGGHKQAAGFQVQEINLLLKDKYV